jgi:hypothetical protein
MLTHLTGYHAFFALTYRVSLYLVHHCHRKAEGLQVKIRNRTVSVDDVLAWDGFACRLLSWIADERDRRTRYYTGTNWFRRCRWVILDIMTI